MINVFRENGGIGMIVPVNQIVTIFMNSYCYRSSEDVYRDSTEYSINDIINTIITHTPDIPVNILLYSVAKAYNVGTVDEVLDNRMEMTLSEFIRIVQQYGFT